MKNKYTRLKWLAAVILAIALYFLVMPLQAASLNTSSLYIPQQEVRGVVTDQAGIPLPGVTVTVKGKNRGTVTDIDGNYSITTTLEDVLAFSFIGFKTQEEAVLGRREIMIRLEEDISLLGEVQINAGYYYTTKRESTGNISRVTAEEIELQPVISPLQALQGRMAGVEIVPGGNQPGMASTIRIRGRNSLREEGNLPLYIIDGVPINSTPIESHTLLRASGIDPLNNLDLSNIESIEVLKDADATAIYGSRGANGVVLITTKRGTNRRAGFEGRIFTGVSSVPNRLELLETPDYLEIRRRAFENDGVEPTLNNAPDLLLWDQEKNTDWQDFFFGGTAETLNANIALYGGNENTSFRIGGSYFSQGTVYPTDYDYQKITGDINLNHTSKSRKLNISFSANYGVDLNNLAGDLILSTNAFVLPPNAPSIFNRDGTLNWEDWAEAGQNNPLAGYYNTSTTKTNNLISNLGLSYELLPGLKVKTNLGYSFHSIEEQWKRPARSYNPTSTISNYSFLVNSNRRSWIIEPQLHYSTGFGKLNLETIVGATFQQNSSNLLRITGEGYVTEALIGNLAAADGIVNGANENVDYRYLALFSRLGLNWDQKYYLNFTGRRDGSSRFGPNNKFSNFGAIGTAWIFTEETLVKEILPILSFGKLRGSYGTTGNDQIGDYGYLDAYEATMGAGGLYPTALANPDYSWEINRKLEGALEVGVFEDKLRFGISWYQNRSSNQLVGYPLPALTGFTSVQANLPATVQNTGWEIEASSNNVNTSSFRWQTSFNISFPRNELISYPNLDQSSYANTYRLGHPLNISLRYQYEGRDPETGYYTIKDINEDNRFDFQDRVVIHNQNRDFFGGLNNSLSYKNLSLQFLWEFVKQKGSLHLFNGGRFTAYRDIVIQALEEDSKYQRISQSPQANTAYNLMQNTLFPIEDASFLRLKTLSLGYNIPHELSQKMNIESIQFFIHGQNLLTLTPYNGMDPEFPYSGTSFAGLRSITGGLQINL